MRFLYITATLVLVLLPLAGWAQDKTRDPLSIPLRTWGLMLGAALLGGFVSWYSKVKRGEVPGYSIFHLIGELVTSALAGLMCFLVLDSFNVPSSLVAAFTGLSGHMGARAITMFEEYMIRRAKKLTGE